MIVSCSGLIIISKSFNFMLVLLLLPYCQFTKFSMCKSEFVIQVIHNVMIMVVIVSMFLVFFNRVVIESGDISDSPDPPRDTTV